MNKPYRNCVVAVVTDGKGRFLVGERARQKGAWQFPQGGVEAEENIRVALVRELTEEVGCGDVEILREGTREVQYDFPVDMQAAIAKKYRGQKQTWFLVRFQPGAQPDLAKSDGEFQEISWMTLNELLPLVVDFKREAYQEGLASLGLEKERL